MIEDAGILVTGATGRVGFPVARALARRNRVFGAARFSDPKARPRLRNVGVTPVAFDLVDDDPAVLPEVDFVFHAAAALNVAPADWRAQMEANVQATGRLLRHFARTRGFVLCSSGSQYAYQGARPLREEDPPGLHLGPYSASKTAAEQLVQFLAREQGTPCTIIRIFSAYGPEGGAPADRLEHLLRGEPIVLHPDAPNRYNPIYEDDYVALAERALEVASVPPEVTNFAGSDTVSAEDYVAYLGGLVGREPRVEHRAGARWPLWPDVTHMHEVLGHTVVPWRDGMRRMVEARHPELHLQVPAT